ncbi:ArnT family glycosyltransferase [Tengunoibacter tsumagoiensis]|uniref:Glycosyltransferase RgtA/B/C/D-like domain-containing protein n=1 Tax=Tengunoibacter tsumagoiensis TaxID=2014871 RepID=A0A402AA66_9CHLR|nr:hypothetical protein [Tengunoibacter tsumagoiensis]GCE16064.1 hypothetical protein KTT_59230 [Tengunoibacter tsumagoiensis]
MNYLRKMRFGRAEIGLVGIVTIAVIIRILLIAQGWPGTNSDEATMGLMALHIANNGELPIFFYGQNYMGALEAYLAAGFFHFFAPSLFALRLSLVIMFALFLFVLYALSCLLYSRKVALWSCLLLSLGSVEMLTRQTKAVGGALETLLFGALAMLLSTWLVLSWSPTYGFKEYRQRSWLYLCLGVSIGLGIWSHLLIIPFVGMACLLLLCFCRRELFSLGGLALCCGILCGAFPLMLFNLQHPSENSLITFLHLNNAGGMATTSTTMQEHSLWDSLLGTTLFSLPLATGATPICMASTTPGVWRGQLSSCMVWQGIWGGTFLLLLSCSTCLVAYQLFRLARLYKQSADTMKVRPQIVRLVARVFLLLCGWGTIFSYLLSPAPALVPITSARYLVGLLIVTPTLVAFLLECPLPLFSFRRVLEKVSLSLAVLLVIVLGYGTYTAFLQVPDVQKINEQQEALIQNLLQRNVTDIYSDYWTCNWLIFQSRERIICSVVDDSLEQGQNRYPSYQDEVKMAEKAFYLLPSGSSGDKNLQQRLSLLQIPCQQITIENYHLYVPVTSSPTRSCLNPNA